jgi:2-polyprenyl-3-methyl-5-hydroxy-6-metoxy-1,4-benzoquinol methylase
MITYCLSLLREMAALRVDSAGGGGRVFELGCGNGSVAKRAGATGVGRDWCGPLPEGIAQANAQWPQLKVFEGSAYDDLAARFGRFPVVTSLEVVEHVYAPRHYAATLFSLLEPGGTAIVSTPYHGYWKNLAMACDRQDGCALHRAVGSRPHQVLVGQDSGRIVARGRVHGHPLRAGRAHT